MTPEAWEAEFQAYNQFRVATGNAPVSRNSFARTVARHNAALASKLDLAGEEFNA